MNCNSKPKTYESKVRHTESKWRKENAPPPLLTRNHYATDLVSKIARNEVSFQPNAVAQEFGAFLRNGVPPPPPPPANRKHHHHQHQAGNRTSSNHHTHHPHPHPHHHQRKFKAPRRTMGRNAEQRQNRQGAPSVPFQQNTTPPPPSFGSSNFGEPRRNAPPSAEASNSTNLQAFLNKIK